MNVYFKISDVGWRNKEIPRELIHLSYEMSQYPPFHLKNKVDNAISAAIDVTLFVYLSKITKIDCFLEKPCDTLPRSKFKRKGTIFFRTIYFLYWYI